MVQSFTQSAPLTDHNIITLSATVTDPDGVGDLSGGALTAGPANTNVGAFSGAVGQYTFTLTWASLPASALTFGTNGGTIALTAHFYDHSSGQGTATLMLALSCSGSGLSACSGACVDLKTSVTNCGQCGRKAPGGVGVCTNGVPMCPAGSTSCSSGANAYCSFLNTTSECGSCGNDCDVWAQAKGLAQHSAVCKNNACTAAVRDTTRASCDAVCASHALTCKNLQSCRIDYSPYYTASIYGSCAYYRFNGGSGCSTETPVLCNAVAPATAACPNSTSTYTFSDQTCLCQ